MRQWQGQTQIGSRAATVMACCRRTSTIDLKEEGSTDPEKEEDLQAESRPAARSSGDGKGGAQQIGHKGKDDDDDGLLQEMSIVDLKGSTG
ncbi:hypothetical protein OPV22_028874 [Ensete ventricosum]|uniref:Uncharacterized protein n=1 Tax=Ensete ventricosum TaxID=4639 RepID=A0A444E3Z2_ENSVE|nr:hypothetical protein OPV22_028874 [Ensete ventricosum]RRT80015.1 hypothetical protein B296_00023458 [Ensete ventricosum]RWW05066.1 hypothetical protein GW17_00031681 [Ensete ventricosum]